MISKKGSPLIMENDTILDEMDLPLANPNEDLETISNNHFKPLFNVQEFEIRSENFRDKGVDFHIEIKKSGKYTNFRFAVQLKATDSIKPNLDGSISLQLDTSNINYLLNSGTPAFYVLYLKTQNTFFYENLNDFVKNLFQKDSNWQKQSSHVLRFGKQLDAIGITEMFDVTLKKGIFQREINEKLALQTASLNSGDKILFDANLNISDDAEIRKLIEAIGLELINEGKWKEIILVHKKASGNVATTSKYNLVLGIANYYSANLIDALSFLRAATKLKAALSEELQNHLLFFETIVKYSIGFISDEDYTKTMADLEKADNVGLYIKLENAKRKYAEAFTDDRYNEYVAEVMEVINNPKANKGIRLNGKCELILFEGLRNNMEYVKGVAALNAIEAEFGANLQTRAEAARNFIQTNQSWYKKVQALKDEAIACKNYFAYYNAVVNEVKVIYDLIVAIDFVHLEQDIPGVPQPEMPDKKFQLGQNLEKLDNAYTYYNHIGHIENVTATLYTKYEILHYLNNLDEANKVLGELEALIDTYDLREQKNKLDALKDSGTTHEKFKSWIDKIFEEADDIKEDYDNMKAEMEKMDEEERHYKSPIKSRHHIHLFPIGYFQFPKEAEEKVYEILNIQEDIKKIFKQILQQSIIPVANIYNNPIIEEGFGEGKFADKGIESWKNIYRVRRAFFENKFYRNENIL